MSEMKKIEVALPESKYEKTVRLAASRGMTGEQLIRQTMRSYAVEESAHAEAARKFGEIVASIQDDAELQGFHMTMEEIDEEIAASRRERASLAKSARCVSSPTQMCWFPPYSPHKATKRSLFA